MAAKSSHIRANNANFKVFRLNYSISLFPDSRAVDYFVSKFLVMGIFSSSNTINFETNSCNLRKNQTISCCDLFLKDET